ncbi:MAG: SLATT domain-containing protein [bacterium]
MAKDYLNGPFERELNYKLWSTKGARFVAARRLETKAKLSVWALSSFSAYLIVFSILGAMFDLSPIGISEQIVTFSLITLSILVLVVSQEINRSEYRWRAFEHHKCALEIGRLYSRLRMIKKEDGTPADIVLVEEISNEYQVVLEKYENHEGIDYDLFRVLKSDYEDHSLGWWPGTLCRVKYFWHTYVPYVVAMVVPGIVLIALVYKLAAGAPVEGGSLSE